MEHNYFTEKLVDHLREDHPDFIVQFKPDDFERFVQDRADKASELFASLSLQGLNTDVIDEVVNNELYAGFKFSKFSAVKYVFNENYEELIDRFKSDQKRNEFILDVTLQCYNIFEKYDCSDDFAYNDLLDYELLGKIEEIIETKGLDNILQ